MRFSEIKQKLYQIGFDDFCQAGSVSKFHPMNIVAESRVLNLQFWVCADGGYGVLETYHISERPLNNYMAPAKRTNFRTQAEVVTALEGIRLLFLIASAPLILQYPIRRLGMCKICTQEYTPVMCLSI